MPIVVIVSSDPEESAPEPDATLSGRLRRFLAAVRDGDEAMVAELVVDLSRRHRLLAPLALAVGGLAMLFTGLRLLVSNWRLTLVQALPATWISLAMYDLRAHALHGRSFDVLRGPILIPIVLAIAAITAASFFLNAVFGFAIVQSGTPKIRPAITRARADAAVILGTGAVVGLMLGLATMVVSRWGYPWFGICLSIVLGVMVVCYVAVPARLIGVKARPSRRDKLTATAVGGVVGTVVCAPPYALGRVGLLMLGSSVLFIPGIVVVAFAAALLAAATGAVKAVKMSAKLLDPTPGRPSGPATHESPPRLGERPTG